MASARLVRWGVVALLGVYAVMHTLAIWTESINWDELALLSRAEKAVRTGVLDGGGRPGLAVALLAPLLDGCDSTIDVVHRARLLWVVFTFGLFAGTFCFVRGAARRSGCAPDDAALGLLAFMLLPVVMRWSIQVRTDQPAVAFAIWGGVALLASRKRAWLAVVAGLAIGGGYLFSQKALYIGALVGLVAVGDLFIDGALELRRTALRLAGLVIGVILAIVLYRALVAIAFERPANAVSLERGLDLFEWYRRIVGYRVYRSMLPTLWPHITLLAIVLYGLARSSRVRGASVRISGVAVATLTLGIGVALFHAAAFPYFTITLGVFAATAIGLGWGPVRELAPRVARYGGAAAMMLLLARAAVYRAELVGDTQAIQRTSLDAADALPRSLRGFQPDGALVCREDPSPLPVFLRENVEVTFSPRHSEANSRALIGEFRSRPIAFLVRMHRFAQFPPEIQKFWSAHYVPYRGLLELAGQRVTGAASTVHSLDLLVAGTYRWFPAAAERIAIAGRTLGPHDTVSLTAGVQLATLLDTGRGDLVLAVDVERAPANEQFYAEMQLAEIGGSRSSWW